MHPHESPDPLRRFELEHQEALTALDKLEAATHALEKGANTPLALQTVGEVYRFLSTTVRQHNENEERALFACLGEDAPTSVFELEHEELRALERRLGRALDGPDPVRQVPEIARAIVDLLRAHIAREDDVLFPMARALLGPAGLRQVARFLPD